MSVELINSSGEVLDFNNSGWFYVTSFAEAHGFRWPLDRDGDEVDALNQEQAAAFAEAIKRGIDCGTEPDAAERVSRELTEMLVTTYSSSTFRDDPILVRPETIAYWKRLARFAEAGAFKINY